jgi:hypothetical protein
MTLEVESSALTYYRNQFAHNITELHAEFSRGDPMKAENTRAKLLNLASQARSTFMSVKLWEAKIDRMLGQPQRATEAAVEASKVRFIQSVTDSKVSTAFANIGSYTAWLCYAGIGLPNIVEVLASHYENSNELMKLATAVRQESLTATSPEFNKLMGDLMVIGAIDDDATLARFYRYACSFDFGTFIKGKTNELLDGRKSIQSPIQSLIIDPYLATDRVKTVAERVAEHHKTYLKRKEYIEMRNDLADAPQQPTIDIPITTNEFCKDVDTDGIEKAIENLTVKCGETHLVDVAKAMTVFFDKVENIDKFVLIGQKLKDGNINNKVLAEMLTGLLIVGAIKPDQVPLFCKLSSHS